MEVSFKFMCFAEPKAYPQRAQRARPSINQTKYFSATDFLYIMCSRYFLCNTFRSNTQPIIYFIKKKKRHVGIAKILRRMVSGPLGTNAYKTFLNALESLKYDKSFYELSNDRKGTYQKCSKVYEACKRLFCDGTDIKSAVDELDFGSESNDELCDNASQLTSSYSLDSSKSYAFRCHIEVESRRTDLDKIQKFG